MGMGGTGTRPAVPPMPIRQAPDRGRERQPAPSHPAPLSQWGKRGKLGPAAPG